MAKKKKKKEKKKAPEVVVEPTPTGPTPVTSQGGKKVVVTDEWGDVKAIPREHYESGAYIDAGLTLATKDQAVQKQREEKYGGMDDAAIALAEGGLRGATIGLSDRLAVEMGIDAEGIAARKEFNPLASGAGEAFGMIAPAVIPGGGLASILGRTAATAGRVAATGGRLAQVGRVAGAAMRATPAGLIARGGRAAEAGLAARMGGGVLAKAGAGAVVGAAEGAMYGAGQAVSESALGDYDLTAEQLMGSMKTGAMFGGAAGGLLAGVGPLAKKAAQKIPNVAKLTPAMINKKVSKESLDTFIANTMFQAAKGPGGGKKFVDRVRRQFGKDGITEVGKVVREEGLVTMGSTLDDIARNADVKKQQWGQQIGKIVRTLDDSADIMLSPQMGTIAKRVDDEVLVKLKNSQLPDMQRMGKRVERTLAPFLEGRELPGKRMKFESMHKLRSELDDLIYRTDRASPVIQELRNARAVVEDEFTKYADKAAKTLGEGLEGNYKQAKRKYAALSTVKDMSEDAASRLDTNRNFSMSDMQAAQIGALVGIGDFAATGDIDPATLVMAFATGRIHRLIRTRGSSIMAAGMDKTSKAFQLTSLRESADKIGKTVTTAAKKLTSPEPAQLIRQAVVPAVITEREIERQPTIRKKFDKKVKLHREIIDNPAMLEKHIVTSMGNAGAVAPNTVMAMAAKTRQAADFLKAKMPVPPIRTSDLTAHLDTRQRVPDSQMAKYLRYADAVENPAKTLKDMGEGKISREGAEAIREVYPKMFEKFETAVIEEAISAKKPVDHKNLLNLSIILDRPLHPSFEPAFVAAVQKVHAEAREARKPPVTRKAPDMAKDHASRAQQLA